jgi:hypothetical protein
MLIVFLQPLFLAVFINGEFAVLKMTVAMIFCNQRIGRTVEIFVLTTR